MAKQRLPKNDAEGSADKVSGATNQANGKPRKPKAGPKKKKAPRNYVPWDFPKNTLEESITVAQAIEEKNAGKPLDAPTLAKYVGYNQANDPRFLALLRSANQYGLVSGSGKTAEVSLDKIGEGIVAPSSPQQRQQSLSDAFENVDLFKKVAEFYSGKPIPEDEYFANTLSREFHVARDRLEHFIQVFTDNLQYLKAFAVTDKGKPVLKRFVAKAEGETATEPTQVVDKDRDVVVRQFLDTCFVLMPFGGWYDRYYEDVYKPAIRDAGFEPVRADDLFHTGSVMEQIWEQVRKAKVLLAELTGKNANVFYELGLSHARGKPVVFVTAALDDVPFDLRHLRVIPYDVRDPNWGEKLSKNISVYLKNAKSDPNKSIPQPFRPLNEREEDEGDEEAAEE